MNGATVFQMVSGLGDAFGSGYSDARKQAQEDEAPTLISNLMNAYKGGGAAVPASGLGAPTAAPSATAPSGSRAALPSFAGGGGAPMALPGNGGDIETRFVDSLKSGGLTNPYGLAAMAAYAGRESGYKPSNITGSWSDPSESGQAGTSGGILSWRGDRFANMRRLTAGAKDPVSAQATFALTENPELTLALQNAKSPEEANQLMANAWRFAGFNRPGGEFAARLGSTRQYLARLGGAPTAGPASPQRSSVAVAENEADVQALEQQMGMLPSAPRQIASAEPDAANLPAVGAQPAGFVVPQGGAPAAPSQAFGGFPGGTATRMTPELQTALNAAWRNPNTRAMAGEIFGQILKGGDKSWDIKEINGQSAWVNTRDGRILPIGQAKRNTATVGNNLVDTATGEVLYSAAEKPTTVSPGSALVGPGGQVIYQAPDRESAKPVTVAAGASLVSPDGKPLFTAPDRDRTVENERKGREEAASIRREIQGHASFKNYEQALPIYGAMVEAAPRNTKAADLNLVYGLGKIMDPGSVVREGEMVMVKNTGSLPDWLVGSINSLNGGQALTPETRNAIMTEAFGRMQAYESALGQETARYRDIVVRAGMNPDDVLPRFSTVKPYEMPKKGGAAPAPKADPSAKAAPTGPVSIPMAAVRALRSDPNLRSQFDAKYGAGASARILGPVRENGPDSILAGP